MGSKLWRTMIAVAGLAVVAVTMGTAVFAAIEDQGDPRAARQTLDAPAGACLENGAECMDEPGADIASICLEGAEDCDDTIESGGAAGGTCLAGTPDCVDTPGIGDGFEQCATEEPCGDFDQPLGRNCVRLESFPVQVRCYSADCAPVDGPVTILPAPAEDLPIETEVEPVDPSLIDPGDDPMLVDPVQGPSEPYQCLPDCSADPIPDACLGSECGISGRVPVRCLPPECTTLEDGTVACPVPLPDECGPTELCLPPDCAVSSDGVVACPEPLPCVTDDAGGCSTPGSCGELGCDAGECAEGVTPEECQKILEEQRRNGAGGGTSSSGGDIDSSE